MTNHGVASGVKWSSVSRFGRLGMQFVTTIVLARLLAPADFGLMGMTLVVIGFVDIFKDLGTAAAIIQRQDLSEELSSSVYWVNVAFGLCAMIIIYVSSPLVAQFYREPRITAILKALSLTFFISGLGILHLALLERKLAFNAIAKIEITAVASGSIIGIASALSGAGVWSLVFQSLSVVSVTTLLLTKASKWRPKLVFRWSEVRSIGNYSLHLTGFNIFNYFSRNADYLLIGKFLGAQSLGYYTLAYNIMLFPLQNISHIIGRVIFPFYSSIQSDNVSFRNAFLKVAGAIALVSFPMMFGIYAVALPFILTLFGARWEPVVILLKIFALVGLFQSIVTTVGAIYQAKGRTDWMFRWGVAVGMIAVISFVIGLKWGIVGVASAYAIASTILVYPNFAIPFRLIDLPVTELGKVLLKPLSCSILMFVSLFILSASLPVGLSNELTLGILVSAGIMIYILASWMINRNHVREVLSEIGFPIS